MDGDMRARLIEGYRTVAARFDVTLTDWDIVRLIERDVNIGQLGTGLALKALLDAGIEIERYSGQGGLDD